jgi:hypothetical protein
MGEDAGGNNRNQRSNAVAPRWFGRFRVRVRDSSASERPTPPKRAVPQQPASSWLAEALAELARRPDCIGHHRAPLAQRLLGAHRRILRGLMLDLGVELAAEQDDDG